MSLYINGVEYGGMAINGNVMNGAINGVKLFDYSVAPQPKPQPQPKPHSYIHELEIALDTSPIDTDDKLLKTIEFVDQTGSFINKKLLLSDFQYINISLSQIGISIPNPYVETTGDLHSALHYLDSTDSTTLSNYDLMLYLTKYPILKAIYDYFIHVLTGSKETKSDSAVALTIIYGQILLNLNAFAHGYKQNDIDKMQGSINDLPITFTQTNIFTTKSLDNKGVLIVKPVEDFSMAPVKYSQFLILPSSTNLSLMDLVHSGQLTMLTDKEWFSNDDHSSKRLNPYSISLEAGKIVAIEPGISSL